MTNNLRKGLLQFLFSGSYMKRWNDKLRPMELLEIDKQAHKMIVAWLLCQVNSRDMTLADRLALEEEVVEGAIFDYMFRLIITDLKPPILYRIKENHEHYQKLANWAVEEIAPHIRPVNEDFWNRFKNHIMKQEHSGLAADIIDAAHQFSSLWEFQLIRNLNSAFDDELPEIDQSFYKRIEKHIGLKGVKELVQGLKEPRFPGDKESSKGKITSLARIANLCGQLRFQKRWSQTPRIPETSVMGHMFLVASYSYFICLVMGSCPARRINSFFCGLFHDIPELLTRDIISPVKKSFDALSEIIREYEESEMQRRIFGPLDEEDYGYITERLKYYLGMETGSEFHDTIKDSDGKILKVEFDKLQGEYNKDEFDPKDGTVIKVADTLSAYIEAYTAIRNGIASPQIQEAFWRLREENAKKTLGNLHIGALFTDFD